MNCQGCVAANGRMVPRPEHPDAGMNGHVYLCTVLRQEGDCPLKIAERIAKLRVRQLELESAQRAPFLLQDPEELHRP